jgi:hypothetical protein
MEDKAPSNRNTLLSETSDQLPFKILDKISKSHLKWTYTLNFKELEIYENLSGPKHFLPVGNNEKDFFGLFVTNDFYNKVAEETNKNAA